MTRIPALSAILALVCLLTPKSACADVVVTPIVTPVNGNNLYSYSVANFGTLPVGNFSMTITGSISGISSPVGWNGSSSFLGTVTFIQWTSVSQPFSVAPGGTVSGFSVLSSFGPGPASFTALDSANTSFSGVTIGPRVCIYSLSSYSHSFTAGGGTGQVTVFAADGCTWNATSGVPWAAPNTTLGSGIGVVSFVVAPNFNGSPRIGSLLIAGISFNLTEAGGAQMSLSPSTLFFNTGGASQTGPQTVTLSFQGVSGDAVWNAVSNQPNINVSPNYGIGNVNLQIVASPGLSGIVTITSSAVSNSPQVILVNVNPATPAPPFGSFDTPMDNSTGIAGAIPVTGWALDNIQVTKVDIWREPVGGETPTSNGLIYIGDAVFVNGARPDVEQLYSNTPLSYRAGWGYLMLTNFLPNTGVAGGVGNGTYKLHAIAHDQSGYSSDLGTRTITVDNAHASRPFGTIDTPSQGGTASGNAFVNFGWALTQNPYSIPLDGSTITVTVDGVSLGHPVYNQFRSDIATSFPGLSNSGGAVGYFFIDTTKLTNGTHTIAWLVSDNAARADGIGSRFFTVFNSAPTSTAAPDIPTSANSMRGTKHSVEIEELGRIELKLGARSGFQLANGKRRELPVGSTLKDGVFYWQAAPGFLGDYTLIFERSAQDPITVHVRISPKGAVQ